MLDAVTTWVAEVTRTFRFADAVDIALVALALFAVMAWLRRGASPAAARRAFVLATFLVSGYLLTRSFELLLVRRLLEALALVALVALVVVFQHELRRLFNRLGSWRPFRLEPLAPASPAIDVLAEAVGHLAERNTGALIALKGREPWGEHVQGGVSLDGRLSQPLLYGIFDPDTPGHDGAVLIEGDRIAAFAAHLPLPTELPKASRYGGTRHAAAAGLTERCDALVIVVSEERGTISLAHEGSLRHVDGTDELAAELERFWRQGRTAGSKHGNMQWLQSAAISLGLAILAWFMFAYSPDSVVRTAEVPVEVRNLPDAWAVESVEPTEVALSLSGPERAFDALDREALTISFDFELLEAGENSLEIDADHVELPTRMQLTRADPASVRVVVRRLEAAEVPVEVPLLGALPSGLTLTAVHTDPERVAVLVAAGQQPPQQVVTEPVDLRSVRGSTEIARAIDEPAGARLAPDTPAEVTVRIEVE